MEHNRYYVDESISKNTSRFAFANLLMSFHTRLWLEPPVAAWHEIPSCISYGAGPQRDSTKVPAMSHWVPD